MFCSRDIGQITPKIFEFIIIICKNVSRIKVYLKKVLLLETEALVSWREVCNHTHETSHKTRDVIKQYTASELLGSLYLNDTHKT